MTVKKDYDFGAIADKNLAEKLSKIDFHKRVILVTAHRRESFGEPLENICRAIKELAENNNSIEIAYPVHMNPNVHIPVNRILKDCKRIHLLPPLDYNLFTQLMNKSFFIITDSGGIQEEAPSLNKPVLVIRTVTERPEAIEAGTVKLVGTSTASIVEEAQRLIDYHDEYEKMANAINPFGDGQAAQRICNCILGLPFTEFRPGIKEDKRTSFIEH